MWHRLCTGDAEALSKDNDPPAAGKDVSREPDGDTPHSQTPNEQDQRTPSLDSLSAQQTSSTSAPTDSPMQAPLEGGTKPAMEIVSGGEPDTLKEAPPKGGGSTKETSLQSPGTNVPAHTASDPAQVLRASAMKGAAAQASYTVGTRVRVQLPDKVVNGMVAVVGMLSIVVAADDGTWPSIDLSDVESTLSKQAEVVSGCKSVVALTYGSDNKSVMGSLFGVADGESLFAGHMGAYMAHVARDMERDSRLRERCERTAQSFMLGDLVQQVFQPAQDESWIEEGLTAAFAVVVRVAYSRRNTAQARKLLILLEMPDGPRNVPKADHKFFPGSWTNWTHVPKNVADSEGHEVMRPSDIRSIDEVSAVLSAMYLTTIASRPFASCTHRLTEQQRSPT